MSDETLTIIDNRTGREYTVPIVDGTIRATDLRQISVEEGDGGLMSYDPAYLNTASCRSAITYIDGDRGILRYRGYPIEQLAEEAGFLETAYLLLEGELPTAAQLAAFEDEVRSHTYVHTNVQKFLEGFRYDAHPMGMLLGAVARSRPSTRTRSRSPTSRAGSSSGCASSRSCRRSRHSCSAIPAASPTCCPGTTSATSRTS